MITFFGDYNVLPPCKQKMKHKQSFKKCLNAFFHINHGENHKKLLKKTTWKGRELIATSVGRLLIFFIIVGHVFFLKNKLVPIRLLISISKKLDSN